MRITHILYAGHAICGKMTYPPRTWPENHVWQGYSEYREGEKLQEGDEYCELCKTHADLLISEQ